MPPLLFMAIRFLLASALLACVARRQLTLLTRNELARCARIGLVFGIAMSLWVVGLAKSLHVGEAAFIASLGIIMVPIIGRVFFKEAIPLNTWLAMPFAITGLGFLSLSHELRFEAPQLLLLGSAAIFALYFNLNTRAANNQSTTLGDGTRIDTPRISVMALTTVVLTVVGLVTGLLSLVLEPWHPTFDNFQPVLAVWIGFSALVSTALRFLVQTYAQSLTQNSHGVVIMVLEPIWTALLATVWFMESMSSAQLVGCALIFMSLLINRFKAVAQLLQRVNRWH